MASTTTMICRQRRTAMLRWELRTRKMIRMMNISCLLMSTENIWGKCNFNATVSTYLLFSFLCPNILKTCWLKNIKKSNENPKMHFCSLSKPRKLHGVDHNGLSLESPEYGIVNYNEWINSNSVSRYLSFSLAPYPLPYLTYFVAYD